MSILKITNTSPVCLANAASSLCKVLLKFITLNFCVVNLDSFAPACSNKKVHPFWNFLFEKQKNFSLGKIIFVFPKNKNQIEYKKIKLNILFD